jgi:hypothetical protein
MAKRQSGHTGFEKLDPKTGHRLEVIGVHAKRDLVRLGSIHAYRLMKERGFDVTLHQVCVLEGVILGVSWDEIPERLKAELKTATSAERPK